jgi:hypothetical protein
VRKTKQLDGDRVLSWLWEFSKKVVALVTMLYIISFIYAGVMCWQAINLAADTDALAEFIREINETFRVVVGGYLIKAAMENVAKIIRTKEERIKDNTIGAGGLTPDD